MPRQPLNLMIRHLRRWAGRKETDALSDGQLLNRFLTVRDEPAFTALTRRYAPLVWAVCRGLLPGECDAEDAFQATFLVLVRRASSLNLRQPLGPWLAEVARRTALKARQRMRGDLHREPFSRPNGTVPSTAEEVAHREMHRLVHEEVQRLPERDRLPLVLCWLQGWSHEAAARELGLPRGSMAKRLVAAQDRLRRRLLARGVTLVLTGIAVGVAEPCSRSLQAATVQASLHWAAHEATEGVIAMSTISLAEGVLRTMTVAKVRAAVLVAFAVGILGAGSFGAWNLARGERASDIPPPVMEELAPLTVSGENAPPSEDEDTVGAVQVPKVSRYLVMDKLMSPVDFKGFPADPKMSFSEALSFIADRYDLKFDVDDKAFKKANPKEEEILSQCIAETEIPPMRNVRLDTVVNRIVNRLKTPATFRVCGDRIVIVPLKYQDLRELFDDGDIKPRVTIVVRPQPLREVLEELSGLTGINMVIDTRVTERAERGQVKATLNNVPLDSAVEMLADMADLKPVVLEGAIYITSKPNAVVL